MLTRIEDAFDRICWFPQSGPSREGLAPGLRVIVERPYGLYYIHDEREVVVIRVLHGARDVASLAERGGLG